MTTEHGIPEDVLKRAARDRISMALARIQRAQNELASACGDLSALCGGIPLWNACSKLTDKVHAFWYRVDGFRQGGRYTLDRTNVEALRVRLQQKPEVVRAGNVVFGETRTWHGPPANMQNLPKEKP